MVALQNINKENITRPVVIHSPTHDFVPLHFYFHIIVLHLRAAILRKTESSSSSPQYMNSYSLTF